MKKMTVSVTQRCPVGGAIHASLKAKFGRIGRNGQYRFGHVTRLSTDFDDQNRRFRHKYMRTRNRSHHSYIGEDHSIKPACPWMSFYFSMECGGGTVVLLHTSHIRAIPWKLPPPLSNRPCGCRFRRICDPFCNPLTCLPFSAPSAYSLRTKQVQADSVFQHSACRHG